LWHLLVSERMFKLSGQNQNMNKYLHITLVLGLLVSFGLSAKNNPEKGEPVKPNAKRAVVAVPSQNVLDWQICIFVKVALERPHSQSRLSEDAIVRQRGLLQYQLLILGGKTV